MLPRNATEPLLVFSIAPVPRIFFFLHAVPKWRDQLDKIRRAVNETGPTQQICLCSTQILVLPYLLAIHCRWLPAEVGGAGLVL
jgi:hypothetical protein